MPPGKFIRTVRAHEEEIVEIQWSLKEGGTYYQRVTVPPKATRDDREKTRADH